ncbi:hypothetical protein LJ737_09330 [Hymenobacter sp. 15J16-1T3B]|uniref:hypothetical protein n=1 Tax=Hymenobacter sp. 15J16-1T3B TaxID=2886941 RepID=UPI001D101483|nr:hypothetical protein [Hymenobacter sp. 15J16-1T3B]MCC3157441.1 hypothetical protein [Hymenobacter sp. 15J16-1T3B]
MKLVTLLLLALMGTNAPVNAGSLPDEPGKTQPEASNAKVRKAPKAKARAPLFARRKAKESDYNRALRRNELLR